MYGGEWSLENSVYDFSRCKLCATNAASPKYKLKKTTVYACAACGFHFIAHLDGMPAEPPAEPPGDATQALDRKAWDYIEGMLAANEKQLRGNLRLIERHLSLSGARCLDIGAGAGLFGHLLAEAGAVVHGIEPRRWQQAFAGFFDVVTLWDVLEHVNFPAETLQNAYNVTKPGGWLFLDTPRRDALFYRIGEWSYRLSGGANPLILESLYSPLPFRHKQIFTLRQLLELVGKIGFSVMRMHSSVLQPQNKLVLVCRKP